MRPRAKNTEKILSETLSLFDNDATAERESAQAQTLSYLQTQSADAFQEQVWESDVVRPALRLQWLRVAAIVAAVAMAALIPMTLFRDSLTVFEDAAGSRKIGFGEVVRSNGGASGTLVLADGSRVEMRENSELSLEKADDGVRIQLRNGDIIVNAAKQHGHLYVQTKDVTVSVVGTVFLVKARETGSRVAVIEGEVHVQQGAKETKLRPGEEMATSSKMETIPLKEEVAWSHQAEAHVALLQQVTTSPAKERLAFEVASIRPSGPAAPPALGARGTDGGTGPNGCGNGLIQLDAGRLLISGVSLQNLVTMAYPDWARPRGGCGGISAARLLAGELEWIKSDAWDIQAGIPKGIPAYTMTKYVAGEAPEIYAMLQTLLADRFKLVLRRETKEIPVYFLTVAKNGPKFNGFRPGKPGRSLTTDENGNVVEVTRDQIRGRIYMLRSVGLTAINATMSDWARTLNGANGRPVLDRTGLTGEYSFYFDNPPETGNGLPQRTIADRQDEIGLKLEDGKAPIEVWMIERAEKPSEN